MAPDRVKKEVVDTVPTILNTSVKSKRSVQKACSLLKLPEVIKNALREGRSRPCGCCGKSLKHRDGESEETINRGFHSDSRYGPLEFFREKPESIEEIT